MASLVARNFVGKGYKADVDAVGSALQVLGNQGDKQAARGRWSNLYGHGVRCARKRQQRLEGGMGAWPAGYLAGLYPATSLLHVAKGCSSLWRETNRTRVCVVAVGVMDCSDCMRAWVQHTCTVERSPQLVEGIPTNKVLPRASHSTDVEAGANSGDTHEVSVNRRKATRAARYPAIFPAPMPM